MRISFRQLLVAGLTTVTLVGLANPAEAALTARASWNMDSLPTMVDSAGGDNNGTTSDVTLSGGAYSFNGSTSYATAPDKANLDPGTANVRVSVRIKFTKALRSGQTYDIIRKGTSTTSGGYYKIEIKRLSSGASVASCRFKDGAGRYGEAHGTTNLAGKGFVTIVCTKTATKIVASAAGQTVTAAFTVGSISNSAPVYIGAKGDGTDSFPGLIDFAKIDIG